MGNALAGHPSTARFLSYKLAVRFVAEDPPPALVERLSRTYELSRGDLREMMRTLVRSPELWRSRHAKVKHMADNARAGFGRLPDEGQRRRMADDFRSL